MWSECLRALSSGDPEEAGAGSLGPANLSRFAWRRVRPRVPQRAALRAQTAADELPAVPSHGVRCGRRGQIDFGTGAWIELPEGKRRRSHVFRIVLSHSRKGYSEAVYRQTTEDFIRCIENAFWHFGGVPKVLAIDNLKAAVSGPRTKTCPKCGHGFNGKPQKGPALEAAPATAAHGGKLDKPQVNKAQAVRDYLKDHPGAMRGEIAAALNKQGVTITPGHVAAIRTKINKRSDAKKAVKKDATIVAAAPAVVEKPTNGGTITLDQVKKVACTVTAIGRLQRVTEVLEIIKELGGVKKFKELAEAMSVTATDEIPY